MEVIENLFPQMQKANQIIIAAKDKKEGQAGNDKGHERNTNLMVFHDA